MPIKVLYLTPYPPEKSGIADYARDFKAALEQGGDYSLELAAIAAPLTGHTPLDFWRIRQRVQFWHRSGYLDQFQLVQAEIGREQHDLFYTLYWLRRLRPALPCYITVHDPPWGIAPVLYPLSMSLNKLRPVWLGLRAIDYTPVGRFLVRQVLGSARGLFVLSNGGQVALHRLMPNYQAVTVLPFLTRPQTSLPAAPSAANAPLNILFMGYWSWAKGLEVLLAAFEKVWQTRPIKLWLAGGVAPGQANELFAEKMQARLKNSPARAAVDLLGFVAADRIDQVFAEADLCVMPYTRSPGYSASSAVFRAMGAGRPIIASRLGTMPETIEHGVTGWLVPPADVEALAAAITFLADQPELRRKLGQAAYQQVSTRHTPAVVASLVQSQYEKLIQERV